MNNQTIQLDNPFVANGAIDSMTGNTGQTNRERIDNEQPDTHAEPEHGMHGSIDFNEQRILADFDWVTAANGNRYLKAKQSYIDSLIIHAPAVLDNFVAKLRDGDVPKDYASTYEDAVSLGMLTQDVINAVALKDEMQSKRELTDLFGGVAWKTFTAFSILLRAENWAANLGTKEPPERLIEMALQAETIGLDAAFWYTRAYTASSGVSLLNWKGTAYDYARYQASNNQKFLGDPTRNRHNNVNAGNATLTLVSRLIPRRNAA